MINFQTYTTKEGCELIYAGSPDFNLLEKLAAGNGDCWHSSFEGGFKNKLDEVVYQSYVNWWYVKDFDNLSDCVSWRVNPEAFVIRKSVWDLFCGFDDDYENMSIKGLALGFDIIRNGGIPYYVKGLFDSNQCQFNPYSTKDLFVFFRKKFKPEHATYLWLRKGLFSIQVWKAFFHAKKNITFLNSPFIKSRELEALVGNPTVSIIIPTMLRQEMTHQLLLDLNAQTYLPTTVIIVDATPEDKRQLHWYDDKIFNFRLIVKWQVSKGSCRARNEAIELSEDDYIIFADDDIRIQPNYIENHLRFLQTYQAEASNGLDIQADNFSQNLEDLENKNCSIKLG
jgi:hypothetical protein